MLQPKQTNGDGQMEGRMDARMGPIIVKKCVYKIMPPQMLLRA